MIVFLCMLLQTFLEQNEGPGLQHLALSTDDIFHTMRELRKRSSQGGFDFMPRASDAYYKCAQPVFLFGHDYHVCIMKRHCGVLGGY